MSSRVISSNRRDLATDTLTKEQYMVKSCCCLIVKPIVVCPVKSQGQLRVDRHLEVLQRRTNDCRISKHEQKISSCFFHRIMYAATHPLIGFTDTSAFFDKIFNYGLA